MAPADRLEQLRALAADHPEEVDLRGVPTAEASDVARAVVGGVVVETFPEPLGELAKRALKAQDRINPDNDERRRYSQRVGGGGTTV